MAKIESRWHDNRPEPAVGTREWFNWNEVKQIADLLPADYRINIGLGYYASVRIEDGAREPLTTKPGTAELHQYDQLAAAVRQLVGELGYRLVRLTCPNHCADQVLPRSSPDGPGLSVPVPSPCGVCGKQREIENIN
ncbi:MAG TPA: hypothetical protein VMX54_15600 [Vicinamibacteria bacterium]|nr:hypothetical protein [Vicinamibacteria bacterium]